MTTNSRINNPESCICCARRADGMAVGTIGHLGFYCNECGPDMAKIALRLAERRAFDPYEDRAVQAVADLTGLTEFTITPDELPQFIKWAVQEFGEAIRKEIGSGKAPF